MSTPRGGPQKRKFFQSGYSEGSGSRVDRALESSLGGEGERAAAAAVAPTTAREVAETARAEGRQPVHSPTLRPPASTEFGSRTETPFPPVVGHEVLQAYDSAALRTQGFVQSGPTGGRTTGGTVQSSGMNTASTAGAGYQTAALTMEAHLPSSIASPVPSSFQMSVTETYPPSVHWAPTRQLTISPELSKDKAETGWETPDPRQPSAHSVASGAPRRKFQFTFRPIGGSYGETVLERLENFRRLFGLLSANEMLPLTLEGAALARRLLASSPAPRGGPACLADMSTSAGNASGVSTSTGITSDPQHGQVQTTSSPERPSLSSYSASSSPQSPIAPPLSSRSAPEIPTTASATAPSMLASSSMSVESTDGSGALAAAAVTQRKITRVMIERRVREHYRYPPSHSVRNVIRRHRTIFEAACFSSAFLEAVRSNFIELLDGVVCSKASISAEFHDRIVRRPLSHQIAEQQSVLVAKRPDLWDRVEPHLRWAPPSVPSVRKESSRNQPSDPQTVPEALVSLESRSVRQSGAPWQHTSPGSRGAARTPFSTESGAGPFGTHTMAIPPLEHAWYTEQRPADSPTDQAELDALFGPLREIRSFGTPVRHVPETHSPPLVLQRSRNFRRTISASDAFTGGSGSAATGTAASAGIPVSSNPPTHGEASESSDSVSTASSFSSGGVP
ncbi:hypothetical protein CCYA_CCYA18G4493 [Cyanidiococcus yangmingshanensis]|nr:hypothetical protein CCYA_CCYA18G4493 [Cyanidiococcus yangmingshanensis]